MIEIILSVLFVKHKGRIVLLLILMVQIIMVSLKIDGFIEIDWKFIILPLLPLAILTAAALVFLTFYTILLKCYYI